MAEDREEQLTPAGGGKKILIIIIAVLVLGGGGAAAFLFMGGENTSAPVEGKKGKAAAPLAANQIGPTFALDTFIVNLDEPGATRYLKVQVTLELSRNLSEAERKLEVRVRDKVIVYLSGLTVSDAQKREAKQELRKQIARYANQVYGEGIVRAVYFKSFVMQ